MSPQQVLDTSDLANNFQNKKAKNPRKICLHACEVVQISIQFQNSNFTN